MEPRSFRHAQLTDSAVESLILKYLLARGDASGRDIAEQIRLPFVLVDALLRQLKIDQLVVHRGAAPMNDYQYQLSELGRERGRRYFEQCSYFGSAPVALADYLAGVQAQSLAGQHPTAEALHAAFADLLLNKRMLDRLGPAISSGRGLFLFGPPGNGKTSIAERVTAAFGEHIWIPRTIGIDGEIIRLYDPVNHAEAPLAESGGYLDDRKLDKRWVRIRRPTIIAGGELTMSALEVTVNTSTGISEAPLQMKSNCGTLVIDDFGRQRMPVDELLNRWIVPLEKRFDFLSLPNGKKISVPFDQLIIFSTNLEPRDLVDEAFLRRIPYKIEAIDPSEDEFRQLFRILAPKIGLEHSEEAVDYLIESHYRAEDRPFRFCHPRDLLLQVANYCAYHNTPLAVTSELLDLACENYFSVI
ncbi:MAG: AAA family ATPase [Pirellulaceae bacterium]|nr:AAA family ATPase [Pirellulaceae bacterium]